MRLYLPHVEVEVVRAKQPHTMPLGVLREDLLRLGQVAEIGKLSLSGIDPCLHPDIDEMLAMARSTNVAKVVSLVTGGLLLHRMSERFWHTVRKIEMNVQPGSLSGSMMCAVQNVARENHIDLTITPAPARANPFVVWLAYGVVYSPVQADGIPLEGITAEKLRKP